MRIAGTTASARTGSSTLTTFVYPSTQTTQTNVATKGGTVPQGFAIGNGYAVQYGASTSSIGNIVYTTDKLDSSTITWNWKQIQSIGQARSVTYIDTGTNKYWVYGQDLNGTFYYTTDGTPQGALSTVSMPAGANATSAGTMIYWAETGKFIAVGSSSTVGQVIYCATANSITGPWTLSTGISETGTAGVQGIVVGNTGTGSDKRLIFTIGGNGANSTYFSAANDPSTLTKQTLSNGDCRALAFTGTHWLYLGDNRLGRAPASSFNNTTGNVVTNLTITGYPGTPRGCWADPNGSGLAWISGSTTALYTSDHGATWTSISALANIASQWKMYANEDFAVIYSSSDQDIAYNRYR